MKYGLQAQPNPLQACRLRAHLDASAFSSMQVYFKMTASRNASLYPCTFREKKCTPWQSLANGRCAQISLRRLLTFFMLMAGTRRSPFRPARHGRLTRALTFTLAPVACSIGMLEIH